ncbi:RagB/SusD family nutrient uptake outer membrane protein [Hymenobacter rubidus]|uniref:RagB/SusD family nutrient uptake outer membrane protein n=1 Tax=Hymenobacter rubidus TaxID=1441626 RepID=UPI001920197A|nr:RagB/SusD family nutrient uptake outer membrane protein [Hymenobacter rubidus]
MKKTFYVLGAALLLAGSLTSCDKKLSIDPVNSINAETALQTSSDVEAALVGCYTGLQSTFSYGGYIQLTSDLLADNGDETFVGTFADPPQIYRKNILRDNGFVSSIWINAYSTINRVNNVLANIDKLDSPAKKSRVEGEAKFIRAALYFELVRQFAKDWSDGTPSANPGVPLVLTPTKAVDATSQVRRNTVAEVYAQILLDLTDAETKIAGMTALPAFAANASAEISNYAAAGLLSRVYLQQARFPDAAAAANRATAGPFSLTSTYAAEFRSGATNTAEDIFAVQISAQSGSNALSTFYKVRGDVAIEDKFFNLYSSTDERKTLFTTTGGKRLTGKFDAVNGVGSNVKVIRLAEMLLNRAEANLRAGTVLGATPLADINRVRARSGAPVLTAVTLADILLERKLELAFEGFRLGDLKRNKESVNEPLPGTAVLPWNSPRLIFPIPKRETDINPNLEQNEYYK